jgi:hypothetical protein
MLQIVSELRNIFDLGSEMGFTIKKWIYHETKINKIHVPEGKLLIAKRIRGNQFANQTQPPCPLLPLKKTTENISSGEMNSTY